MVLPGQSASFFFSLFFCRRKFVFSPPQHEVFIHPVVVVDVGFAFPPISCVSLLRAALMVIVGSDELSRGLYMFFCALLSSLVSSVTRCAVYSPC